MSSVKPRLDSSTSRGVAQAYILFVVSLGLVLTVGSAVQLTSLGIGLAITELALILLPALVFVLWKRLPLAESLRLRAVPIPVAMVSIPLGITGWGVAAGMHQLTAAVLGKPPNIGLEPKSLPELLVLYFSGALLAGICEEALFRGAIQGVLRRRGVAWSVIVTGVLFGVYHLSPWVILPAVFLGIVMGTLVERTGSIVPSILMHITCNVTAFTASYWLGDAPDSSTYAAIGILVGAFCLVAAVVWRMTNQANYETPLLATVPAGLMGPSGGMAKGMAMAATLLVATAIVIASQFLGAYAMSTDDLAPDVGKGDRVVVLRQRWIHSEIQPGDIVSFRREGKTRLRKVARSDDTSVWVQQGHTSQPIPRQQITGKVIRVLRLSAEDDAPPDEEILNKDGSRKSSSFDPLSAPIAETVVDSRPAATTAPGASESPHDEGTRRAKADNDGDIRLRALASHWICVTDSSSFERTISEL